MERRLRWQEDLSGSPVETWISTGTEEEADLGDVRGYGCTSWVLQVIDMG